MGVRGQVDSRFTGCAVVLVLFFVVSGIFILPPSMRRAKELSEYSRLSAHPITISMHDPGQLAPEFYYSQQNACRLRLPAGLPFPTPTSVPESKGAFIAAKPGLSMAVVSRNRRNGDQFSKIAMIFRTSVIKPVNGIIEEEAVAKVNGMTAHVLTFRYTAEGAAMRCRAYCIDGDNQSVYVIQGSATADTFSADTFDSSVSTFETGSWPRILSVPVPEKPRSASILAPEKPGTPASVLAPEKPQGPPAPVIGQVVEARLRIGNWSPARVTNVDNANQVAAIQLDDGSTEIVSFADLRPPSATPARPSPPSSVAPPAASAFQPRVDLATPAPGGGLTTPPGLGQRVQVYMPDGQWRTGSVTGMYALRKVAAVQFDDGTSRNVAFESIRILTRSTPATRTAPVRP